MNQGKKDQSSAVGRRSGNPESSPQQGAHPARSPAGSRAQLLLTVPKTSHRSPARRRVSPHPDFVSKTDVCETHLRRRSAKDVLPGKDKSAMIASQAGRSAEIRQGDASYRPASRASGWPRTAAGRSNSEWPSGGIRRPPPSRNRTAFHGYAMPSGSKRVGNRRYPRRRSGSGRCRNWCCGIGSDLRRGLRPTPPAGRQS